jgi:hypothetical protein
MKVRHGFVSNSSSSSFVVIAEGNLVMKNALKDDAWENRMGDGQYEFGWQNERYGDVDSRANFAFLQALETNNTEWLAMIEKVITEHTGAMYVLHGFDMDKDGWLKEGYIDHQSSATEGQNTEMFKSEEALRNFIFANGSYIQCGNDN